MSRILLYYPTIDIPKEKWLYSGLLYSDKVSTIVPFFNTNHHLFPDDLSLLEDQGEYEPMLIEKFLLRKEFEEFKSFFINSIESKEFQAISERKANLSGRNLDYILYNLKMTEEIIDYLSGSGLIIKQNNGTVLTDEVTALFYMGLLAQYVAKVENKDETGNFMIPSTDDKRYENIAFRTSSQKTHSINFILNNCIPVPIDGTPLDKIVAFKKKRKDELNNFREFIFKTQNEIKKASDEQEIREIQTRTKEKIEVETNRLIKVCKDSKLKTFFTSFESLLKIDNPKLFQLLTVTGIISTPINPIAGLIAGSIGLAGGWVSSYLETKKNIQASEFSYLFQAQKEGLIDIAQPKPSRANK